MGCHSKGNAAYDRKPGMSAESQAERYESEVKEMMELLSQPYRPLDMELSGSERQIAWAQKILMTPVKSALAEHEGHVETLELNLEREVGLIREGNWPGDGVLEVWEYDKPRYKKANEALLFARKAYEMAIGGMTSAGAVIDARDSFGRHGAVTTALYRVVDTVRSGKERTVEQAADYIRRKIGRVR